MSIVYSPVAIFIPLFMALYMPLSGSLTHSSIPSACSRYSLVPSVDPPSITIYSYSLQFWPVTDFTVRLSPCRLLNDMVVTVILGYMSCFDFVAILPIVSVCSGI